MLGRTVLLKFLPAQIPAYVCDTNLQDHVCDIKTLQSWMGHKDLASTMIYLKAVRSKDAMARVNSSQLAALAV